MSDQEKNKETSVTAQPNAENKKESGEMSEEELKKVTGGTLPVTNITKTKDDTAKNTISNIG
jgi:bacteriocin-like protein